ncbi:MAG: Nif3-like dinuclear metal center hexameric protein [Bacteroidales bacterium]|nr:Nif3-like dinuclear metal center hexameric protein [Bacteroidales bacterium]MBD5216893.1 Nif3-like dinuclear metal center hexameric protein [Bacteroidales bacterium]
MPQVKEIAEAIEKFAPKSLQESYDNTGLQIGNPDMEVNGALVCLDVTEEILDEAVRRECDIIISHHPLLFKGLKRISGSTPTERIVARAIRDNIAIYSAHTNLDSARRGVSYEIAHSLELENVSVLSPGSADADTGLGIIGDIAPTPTLELLRRIKNTFDVRHLRYSAQSPQIVIRRVAVCGGAGAEFIPLAFEKGADCYITGDLKYHDFTTWGPELLLADIGHYESELCATKILARILRKNFGDLAICRAETDTNPISFL